MKTNLTVLSPLLCMLLALLFAQPATAQTQRHSQAEVPAELVAAVLQQDSLFWVAYNNCNLEGMRQLLANDLEFYHDKGGLTLTADSLITSMASGICSKENWRLRRELVAGSLQVYPIHNYGMILSGEHFFYIRENGKEQLDGIARFTNLWHYKNNRWQMTRVLSYDHGPASSRK